MPLQVVHYQEKEGEDGKPAMFFHGLPKNKADLKEIADILMGKDPRSKDVLFPVVPGSVPDDMSAEHYAVLAFNYVSPSTGMPFTGGVWSAIEWVTKKLDPIMPDGWGTALTQPALFPVRPVKSNKRMWAIVLSPMNRAKTGPYTFQGL